MKKQKRAANLKATKGKLRDMVDYDYIDDLDEEEREWLRSFTSLYYHTNVEVGATIVDVDAIDTKKLYADNNARIRDMFNRGSRDFAITEATSYEMEEFIHSLIDAGYSLDEIPKILEISGRCE